MFTLVIVSTTLTSMFYNVLINTTFFKIKLLPDVYTHCAIHYVSALKIVG